MNKFSVFRGSCRVRLFKRVLSFRNFYAAQVFDNRIGIAQAFCFYIQVLRKFRIAGLNGSKNFFRCRKIFKVCQKPNVDFCNGVNFFPCHNAAL